MARTPSARTVAEADLALGQQGGGAAPTSGERAAVARACRLRRRQREARPHRGRGTDGVQDPNHRHPLRSRRRTGRLVRPRRRRAAISALVQCPERRRSRAPEPMFGPAQLVVRTHRSIPRSPPYRQGHPGASSHAATYPPIPHRSGSRGGIFSRTGTFNRTMAGCASSRLPASRAARVVLRPTVTSGIAPPGRCGLGSGLARLREHVSQPRRVRRQP